MTTAACDNGRYDSMQGRLTLLLRYGDLVLDPAGNMVRVGDETVDPGTREFTILQLSLEHSNVVLSHDLLEESGYGWGEEIGSHVVEVHIHNLRCKLGKQYIRTVGGAGYVIE